MNRLIEHNMTLNSSPPCDTLGTSPHATTIICVRKHNQIAMAGDGQVTLGSVVVKNSAKKVRRLKDGSILAGFAGATADAFTLLERLEIKLEKHPSHLVKACVELAKDWRTDKYLRQLQAMMIVANAHHTLLLTGSGDVIEPENAYVAIGSGGSYAQAAAAALISKAPDLSAQDIALTSMEVAASLCIYTNHSFSVETLELDPPSSNKACAP